MEYLVGTGTVTLLCKHVYLVLQRVENQSSHYLNYFLYTLEGGVDVQQRDVKQTPLWKHLYEMQLDK